MEGFYKVPAKVWEELIDTYRDEITDNTQLTKAAKLAAEKNLWSASGYPPCIINANIKPLSRELGHLTKRIRAEGDDEGEPFPPRKNIKATPKNIKATPKIKTKPSTRRRLLPTRPDQTNPKPKKRKRQTEVEKLQPRPGWEEWGAGRKLRRQLEYDESP